MGLISAEWRELYKGIQFAVKVRKIDQGDDTENGDRYAFVLVVGGSYALAATDPPYLHGYFTTPELAQSMGVAEAKRNIDLIKG
ncbi:MAG: hypothetical protein AAFU71_12050 [Cyanobacteria bacterium J06632_22]